MATDDERMRAAYAKLAGHEAQAKLEKEKRTAWKRKRFNQFLDACPENRAAVEALRARFGTVYPQFVILPDDPKE